jgi:hypothetical protein
VSPRRPCVGGALRLSQQQMQVQAGDMICLSPARG